MRRAIRAFGLFLAPLAVVLFVLCVGVQVARADTYQISGRVVNQAGAPVVDNVSLFSWTDTGWQLVAWPGGWRQTHDGSYSFDCAPGRYRVGFGVSGWTWYRPVYYAGSSTLEGATDIEIVDASRSGVDATLAALPAITGQIEVFSGDSPPSYGALLLYKYNDSTGQWDVHDEGYTPLGGVAYTPWWGPGRYRIAYRAPGFETAFATDPAHPGQIGEFALEWDGTTDFGTIVIKAQTVVSVLAVSSATGLPVEGGTLEIYKKTDAGWDLQASVGQDRTVFDSGVAGFTCSGLFDGVYRMVLRSNSADYTDLGYPAGHDVATAQDLVFTHAGHYAYTAVVEPMCGSISGTVTVSPGGGHAGGRIVSLFWAPKWNVNTLVATTTTDATGEFRFDAVEPGAYSFLVQDPSGECADEWWGNYQPMLAYQNDRDDVDSLSVSRSTDTPVVLDTYENARFRGFLLEQGTGRPVPGVTVTLVDLWGRTYSCVSHFDGSFDSGPVPPCDTGYHFGFSDPAGAFAPTVDAGTRPIDPGGISTLTIEMRQVAASTHLSAPVFVAAVTGDQVSLTATLTTQAGVALTGQTVALQTSTDELTWSTAATSTTGTDGGAHFSVQVASSAFYRFAFAGVPGTTVASTSDTFRLAPATDEGRLPGVDRSLPLSVTSWLSAAGRPMSVYRVHLRAGQLIRVGLTGGSGTDFAVALLSSTATSTTDRVHLVASSDVAAASTETLSYEARTTDYFYLEVYMQTAVPGSYGLTASIATQRVSSLSGPSKTKRGEWFTLSGYVTPQHDQSANTRMYAYRLVHGRWKLFSTLRLAPHPAGADRSVFSARYKGSVGRMRVRAAHTSGTNVIYSPWKYVTVK